jgi:RNA polymerase sigma-70 factor (ECF subfamily)
MQEKSSKARFSRIAMEFMKPLYRYGYWLAGDACAAEDLVQETLARAWSGFGALRDERAAKAWLFTILRREFLRKPVPARRGNVVPLEDDILGVTGTLDHVPDMIDVRHALKRLPTEHREALLLQVMDGFSLQEIGDLLDISANTAATRVFRARLQLREMLSDGAPDLAIAEGKP